jgi:hypothetical protein
MTACCCVKTCRLGYCEQFLTTGQGISLSIEQYAALLKAIPSINSALRDLGHDLNDPDGNVADGPAVSKKPKKEKPSKANIEATSEEDN